MARVLSVKKKTAQPSSESPGSNANAGADPPSGFSLPDPIRAQVSSVGDAAADIDSLGFELYVNALADFLVAPNTKAPLTCSIEGSWGSGKSSFMLQLQNRLKLVAPASSTIQFNAWKYDKQEELWAAFALKVTRTLREQLSWMKRLRGDFRLFRTRIKGWTERLSLLALALAWLLLLVGFGGVITWSLNLTAKERVHALTSLISSKESEKVRPPAQTPDPDPWTNLLSLSPMATSAILIVLLFAKIPESLRKRLFEAQLEKYIDRPDYKGKAAFVDAFSDDFAKTIAAYAPASVNDPNKRSKIFVFIDDLDRCEAPKAADLMQAMNLMIGEGNPLIFILGLDRAKVAAAIAFKFREIVPFLDSSLHPTSDPSSFRSFGDAFLEKFIQLSFRLPISSNEDQARRFLDSLIVDASTTTATVSTKPSVPQQPAAAAEESKRRALRIESGVESDRLREVVMLVRKVLEYSPRRIKNFLNAFRLTLYIASSQGLLDVDENGVSEVTPEQLGKFLAVTLRYPDLRTDLIHDPNFLATLEGLATGELSSESPATEELDSESISLQAEMEQRWGGRPGIIELLGFVPEGMDLGTWRMTYSLKDFPYQKFDSVLPGVAPPGSPRTRTQEGQPAPPASTATTYGATVGESTSSSRSNSSTTGKSQASQSEFFREDEEDAPSNSKSQSNRRPASSAKKK